MRPGVRIGVDVGRSRVGLARTDAGGLLALPLETFPRDAACDDWSSVAVRVSHWVSELTATEVIVGLPLSLSGQHTPSTDAALACADAIQRLIAPVPVRVVDERLSTVSAQQNLRDAGLTSREQRGVIDQQAAVVILEHALDIERVSGHPAGRPVSDTTQ